MISVGSGRFLGQLIFHPGANYRVAHYGSGRVRSGRADIFPEVFGLCRLSSRVTETDGTAPPALCRERH